MQSLLTQTGYDPAQNADNGNRFLCGNGYMGIRGTFCEAGPEQMVAVNLAGIHHRKGDAWEEPLNAPNPFFLKIQGFSLPDQQELLEHHTVSVDIVKGCYQRESTFRHAGGTLCIRQERFCSMEDVHVAAQRVTLCASQDMQLHILHGIDAHVWDLHGPHYETMHAAKQQDIQVVDCVTDDGKKVAVAARESLPSGIEAWPGVEESILELSANIPFACTMICAIFTSNDTDKPSEKALECIQSQMDYETLQHKHTAAWSKLWEHARVEIEGDEQAEFAINYSLYHLMSIAPRHQTSLSVPARGLSGQTYKGAIFWDTEMFMLDFYLACMPEVARSCLQYRIDALPAAMEKAASYGLQGAFYAWESVDGGKDACSDYNVTDVFTGRPMRTFFKDKQVHISAAIVFGLRHYLEWTRDDSLMRHGGAVVILECARFYMSLISKKILSDTYDLCDVIGPDEYHEHVNNNAYTNEMARETLRYACKICPKFINSLSHKELHAFEDAAEHLKSQYHLETGLVEQFDGYFGLEDASVQEIRSRLLDPKEYWGGAYGVASQTQVIKQADVIAMLCMLNRYTLRDLAVNYDYYEPRTEHGSSLSACMYAQCACMIGRPDEAYPLFMKSAEADIRGGGKQWAGLVYIGGTHPAAAGGAYKVLLHGFLGLSFEDGEPKLHPHFPKHWKRVRLQVIHHGKPYIIDCDGSSADCSLMRIS